VFNIGGMMNEVCAEVGEGGGWWYGGIIPGKF